jgi:DNA (cytosine-5)-methyltransferase 1
MADGILPLAPIWNDINTFSAKNSYEPSINIIYGGFPCQDISIAGAGKGLAGERSGLFFEIVRLCREIEPRFIFLENVPAITSRGGNEVVRQIASMGYDCRWCIISAASIGAHHKRERWFLLAHANGEGLERIRKRTSGTESQNSLSSGSSEDVADSRCKYQRSQEEPERPSLHTTGCDRFWESESSICRMADGVPNRVERIKCLGNSVVPQQAKEAFKILMGLKF